MKINLLLFVFSTLILFFFLDCKNPTAKKVKVQMEKLPLTSEQTAKYMDKGKQISGATFMALSQQLQKAVKEGGVPNAIQYCNLAAYPIRRV